MKLERYLNWRSLAKMHVAILSIAMLAATSSVPSAEGATEEQRSEKQQNTSASHRDRPEDRNSLMVRIAFEEYLKALLVESEGQDTAQISVSLQNQAPQDGSSSRDLLTQEEKEAAEQLAFRAKQFSKAVQELVVHSAQPEALFFEAPANSAIEQQSRRLAIAIARDFGTDGLNKQIAELLEGPVRSILNRIHKVYPDGLSAFDRFAAVSLFGSNVALAELRLAAEVGSGDLASTLNSRTSAGLSWLAAEVLIRTSTGAGSNLLRDPMATVSYRAMNASWWLGFGTVAVLSALDFAIPGNSIQPILNSAAIAATTAVLYTAWTHVSSLGIHLSPQWVTSATQFFNAAQLKNRLGFKSKLLGLFGAKDEQSNLRATFYASAHFELENSLPYFFTQMGREKAKLLTSRGRKWSELAKDFSDGRLSSMLSHAIGTFSPKVKEALKHSKVAVFHWIDAFIHARDSADRIRAVNATLANVANSAESLSSLNGLQLNPAVLNQPSIRFCSSAFDL